MSEKTSQASKDDQVRLVQQAQQGDVDAFSELFNRWNQPLLQYLYHTLGNSQEAEDVAQDAFLRAYQRLDQLGPPWDFKSWLYRIGTNLAMDHLQRERRYISVDSSDEAVEMELPSGTQPVERQVEKLEQQRQIWNALGTLPTLYRQALILRELNGLSYEEIHVALDCSYENARQLVHRARLRFRDEYGFTTVVAAGVPRCHVLGDLLSAYHDGQLTPEERRRVEAHLATCDECRETKEEMRKIAALLLLLPPHIPSRGWMEKVRKRLGAQGAGPSRRATIVVPPPASAPPMPPAPPAGYGRGGGAGPLTWSAIVPFVLALVGLLLIGLFLWNRLVSPPGAPTATQGVSQSGPIFTKDTPTRTPGITAILPSVTPTASVTPTLTSTPGAPMLVLIQNANCRRGPGSVYPVATSFLKGQNLQVDGRNEELPRWWWVLIPASRQHCWISNAAGMPDGDTNSLPVKPAPPTPTITPKPGKPLVDADSDGFLSDVDCNDLKDKIHPGAPETPDDKVDSNCNGDDDS